MLKNIFLNAILIIIISACNGTTSTNESQAQMPSEVFTETALSIVPSSTSLPTQRPEASGPFATLTALIAQVTLNLPTTAPSLTPIPTFDYSSLPIPIRNTEADFSVIDRPDDSELHQIHFIYAIPSDGSDKLRDVNGEIELSANAANHWLSEQSGGFSLRYDTFQGQLDITFLKLPFTANELSSKLGLGMVSGLDQYIRDIGFPTENKIYFVYYEGLFELSGDETACGVATRPPNDWGVTGMLFLQAYSPEFDLITCPDISHTENYADWLELVMLHEIFHILGAVPNCGPNSFRSHVNDNRLDLMSSFFNPDTAPFAYLDFNNDDYFGHGDLSCPDLANSVFLDPLPANPKEPPSWTFSSGRRTFNPLILLDWDLP